MSNTDPSRLRPMAADAIAVLGQQIKTARLRRNMKAADTAARLGVSPTTYRAIENGTPTVQIGHVLNAASLLGVRLFGLTDPVDLLRLRRAGAKDLALIRSRAVEPDETLPDGFGRRGVSHPAQDD